MVFAISTGLVNVIFSSSISILLRVHVDSSMRLRAYKKIAIIIMRMISAEIQTPIIIHKILPLSLFDVLTLDSPALSLFVLGDIVVISFDDSSDCSGEAFSVVVNTLVLR